MLSRHPSQSSNYSVKSAPSTMPAFKYALLFFQCCSFFNNLKRNKLRIIKSAFMLQNCHSENEKKQFNCVLLKPQLT